MAATTGADSLDGTTGADTIDGLAGNDTINGKEGADSLTGGDGDDSIDSGAGSDTVNGGAGADKVVDSGGSDLINGGAGIDTISVTRSSVDSTDAVTVNGGIGADVINFTGAQANSATVSVDGGEGANVVTVQDAKEAEVKTAQNIDTVKITGAVHATAHTGGGADVVEATMRAGGQRIGIGSGAGNDNLTLHLDNSGKFTLHLGEGTSGVGQDVVVLAALGVSDQDNHATLVIRDFQAGDTGDQLQLDKYFQSIFTKDKGHDWFNNGHLRLVQDGTDARLQIDVDGVGKAHTWENLVLFQNMDAHDLTAFNLHGVDPVITDLSADFVV